MYNMRTSCEFRYYHKSYIHIATSNVLKFKGGIYAPLQGHLALTGDPTQMRVMWVSGTGNQFLFFVHVFTFFFFFQIEKTLNGTLIQYSRLKQLIKTKSREI